MLDTIPAAAHSQIWAPDPAEGFSHCRRDQPTTSYRGEAILGTGVSGLGWPTQLDKIKNLHSTDSIDTENSGTRGRSIWVHSRLLDSSVPALEGGAVGNGVARSLAGCGRKVMRSAAVY